MTLLVTSDDLGTYLGVGVDANRATYLLTLAQSLCESVVNPLPDAAAAVVLDVAARGYSNPTNTQQETVGVYSAQRPGGLTLTRANKADLRRLAGGGGAFTIDVMPSTAGDGLPVWDVNQYDDEGLGWGQNTL